jgi:hypothetical protein
MTRYGFVPHGRVDHGNLCGPCDRPELTFSAGDQGRDRPAPAIAREEPAVYQDPTWWAPAWVLLTRWFVRSHPFRMSGFRHRFGRRAPMLNRPGSLRKSVISKEAT